MDDFARKWRDIDAYTKDWRHRKRQQEEWDERHPNADEWDAFECIQIEKVDPRPQTADLMPAERWISLLELVAELWKREEARRG